MKTTIIGLTTGLFLLFFVGVSLATVIYEFEFYDLNRDFDDFNITLSYSDYVTTTGMSLLSTTHSTPLGYSVMYAGTNDIGWWGFDDDNSASLSDFGYTYGGNSFLFTPQEVRSNYFTNPGIYAGFVIGNTSFGSLNGGATLTITDTSIAAPVPEPGTLLLLGSGLAGLALYRRRMNKA